MRTRVLLLCCCVAAPHCVVLSMRCGLFVCLSVHHFYFFVCVDVCAGRASQEATFTCQYYCGQGNNKHNEKSTITSHWLNLVCFLFLSVHACVCNTEPRSLCCFVFVCFCFALFCFGFVLQCTNRVAENQLCHSGGRNSRHAR